MDNKHFKAEHINATCDDFLGNGNIGRYIFFPGSDGRAKQIAEHFSDVTVKSHSRAHNLYKGTIVVDGKKVDVASISSGMGTPSLDIVLNELVKLGAKRFLRVGTAGLLQPAFMKGGDLVIATAAVRDDGASRCYVPLEYPAVASSEFVVAAESASKKLHFDHKTHVGIIHSKDSLFAREFGEGPLAAKNKEYMDMLRNAGVIASEMEAAALFTLVSLFNHKHKIATHIDSVDSTTSIKAGAVCVVLGRNSRATTKIS